MLDERVVVVGTTADYVDMIATRFPGRAVFVTDSRERASAFEPAPEPSAEVLCDLTDFERAVSALGEHVSRWKISLTGVACYDCESMALASYLASWYRLPYPSTEAIAAARDKHRSKELWRSAGLPSPQARIGRNLSDAIAFMVDVAGPVVIKPTSGSGSELVFVCRDETDLKRAIDTTHRRLSNHANRRMYPSEAIDQFTMEEFIAGPEYSCDYLVDHDRIEIIRIARKIPATGQPAGTTLAYVVPAELPQQLDPGRFAIQTHLASRALGIERALCMLDFIVRDGQAVMLELTPRPGGDCLPPLILQASGLDMLGLALDFARGAPVVLPEQSSWRRLVGVRLIAGREGILRRIDTTSLTADARVLEIYLKRRPGHTVVLPPADYDSRILGHIVFDPSGSSDMEQDVKSLVDRVQIDMEAPLWVTRQASL